jgi:hypothetical protein
VCKEARVTLELSRLTEQVQAMGEECAARRRRRADLTALARQWLSQYADQGETLRHTARAEHAAVPAGEPLDAAFPLPATPGRFTVVAADGAHIPPDPHGIAQYYIINIGSLVYRHGSDDVPQARSRPTLGYTEADLYEDGQPVAGQLLDMRRDLAELACLADHCVSEAPGPTVALVDGTLILWTLKDTPAADQERKVGDYVRQLERIRQTGAAIAAFVSRPRRGEVTRLLHLAHVEGDARRFREEPNPLERLPDRAVFGSLPAGARSALFVSPNDINQRYYAPEGHTVYFFYLNLAEEGSRPAVARVEVPAWVAEVPDQLALVHGAIVAQARVTGDYPYALARADEMAFVSGPEREALEGMVTKALLRAGVMATLSPKRYYKTLTRRGRRKHRL